MVLSLHIPSLLRNQYLRAYTLILLVIICFGVPTPVHATTEPTKGLLISPLRSYVTIDAGTKKPANFTIANLTDRKISVSISIKQFSVSDYAYDYRFSTPNNNWLTVAKPVVSLKPGESQTVDYSLTIPTGTAPGGNYYTLFASANLAESGLEGTVQAATLLYVTINGSLIRSSEYKGSAIPRFLFSKQLNYTFDVKNTGNVHYFAYFSGTVSGPFTHPDATGTSHLLLPGVIRQVSGNIPAPVLPGVYRATYSYTTDAGTTISRQRLVIFIPPWSIAFALITLLGSIKLYRWRRSKIKQEVVQPKDPKD